jgi:cytochrome c-type biogenesis protein CcmH/NrfF
MNHSPDQFNANKLGIYLCFSVAFFFLLSVNAWSDSKPRMEDIAGKLACYCGTCPHLVVTRCGCSVADQIMTEIQTMIDAGQSEDQIVQSYVAKYGQTVLAAPTKSGFNLSAWAIPFIAFFIGGAILFSYLKKQRNLPEVKSNSDDKKPFDDRESHYRDLLKKELDERK